MTSKTAVAIATFLQTILGISFFIEQRSDMCSTAPDLASWIFLIAFVSILVDLKLYPFRYMHLPYVFQLMAETLLSVLLMEFGTLILWCTIERITCKLCKLLLLLAGVPPTYYYKWERYILGVATTSISLTFFVCVGHATDHFYVLRKKSTRACSKVVQYANQIWSKCRQKLCEKKESISANCSPTFECNQPEASFRRANYERVPNTGANSKRRQNRSRSRR